MGEWKDITIGELLKLQRGHDLPQTEFIDGPNQVAGSNGPIGFHNKFTALGPGLTIGRSGNSIGVAHYYENNFWAHNTTLYAKEFYGSYPKFIYFLFKSIDFKSLDAGSAIPSLNRNHVHPIVVRVPRDIGEQKAIAEVLSSLDDKIDLLHRQNKTLESLAETLFRQWFVEEANEDWEEGILTDEFDFTMGQSPRGETFNEDGIGTIFYQGRTDFSFRFPEPRVFTVSPKRFAEKFDTLVSVRAPVGDMNMAIERCCLGRGVAGFRYKRNPMFHSYTYYKMRSLMEQIKQFEDNGTVFGSIGKEDFKKLENSIPSPDLAGRFQAVASPLDEKIFQNTTQIANLKKVRDLLLPKLINGHISIAY